MTEESIIENKTTALDVSISSNDEVTTSFEALDSEAKPASVESTDTSVAEGEVVDGEVVGSLDIESQNGEKITQAPPEVIQSLCSPALLEALLLAHGEPVSFIRLQEVMRCAKAEVSDALESLRMIYESKDSGLEIVTVGERLQMRTKAAFGESVRELLAVKPRRLSQAALETLAVVAYQQPIVKSEIDKIRGVDVNPTIKTLLDRKLVKILGYQASVGQPSLYGTTEEFLRIFGLKGLSELPLLRDLKSLAKEPGESGDDDPQNCDI